MAEFVEVMKQKKRMCNDCEQVNMCHKCYGSMNYINQNPQEAEEIIMKWASEHPIKTNADKFKEVFGLEPYSEYCPSKCTEKECLVCEYRHFWSQEYKEPKEPKEV